MLVAALAILNARYFSPMEVRALEREQKDLYGGEYFPTWYRAQSVVFEQSLAGSWARAHLTFFPYQTDLPRSHFVAARVFPPVAKKIRVATCPRSGNLENLFAGPRLMPGFCNEGKRP